MDDRLFMVFDVECLGLHGDAFSVGWTVVDQTGKELEWGAAYCDMDLARGSDADRKWCTENVIQPHGHAHVHTRQEVREQFWKAWMRWKANGALLAADVAWPCEARFLAACINDDARRAWDGPYPLIDIASVRFAKGLDPLGAEDRHACELPAHDPLRDAIQSARLLIEALNK